MHDLITQIKKTISYYIKRKIVPLYRSLFSRKTIVVIFSTMRAGSTLLKALIAQAPDTSNIEETDYRRYYSKKDGFNERVYKLSKKNILVLKYPHAFPDMGKVWTCPTGKNVKIIVLIRDVYDVVRSLKKRSRNMECSDMTNEELISYWCESYESILKTVEPVKVNLCFIRYEDIVSSPKDVTAKIFRFIGSKQKKGVNNYRKPENYEWRWGFDDGGENIKKLKVIKYSDKRMQDDRTLMHMIDQSPRVRALRKKFGYLDNYKTQTVINGKVSTIDQ